MKEETQLKNEWIKHYGLTAISNNKYYKIAGCFIVGFELIKTQGEIQPHFVVYPLWKGNIKECFSTPYILYCIEDKHSFNYQIPISKMLEIKETIFQDTEDFLKFNLNKNIKAREFLKIIEKIKKLPTSINNSRIQGSLTEVKTYISTFLNDKDLFRESEVEMDEIYTHVDHDSFERRYGKHIDWKNKLISVFTNRQTILDKIEENIVDSNIKERVELLP